MTWQYDQILPDAYMDFQMRQSGQVFLYSQVMARLKMSLPN